MWIILFLPAVLVLAACHREITAIAPEVRPVRTVTVAIREVGETTVLTGHVEAENAMEVIQEPVGDQVRPGQIVAKLDPQDELNGLRSAQANLIVIPASALTEFNGKPAVWLVDASSLTVSLRNVDVLRFDPGTVVVSHGLDTGEIVVTAGVQALHPSQKVRLLASSP